jgi:hypothetical protein
MRGITVTWPMPCPMPSSAGASPSHFTFGKSIGGTYRARKKMLAHIAEFALNG